MSTDQVNATLDTRFDRLDEIMYAYRRLRIAEQLERDIQLRAQEMLQAAAQEVAARKADHGRAMRAAGFLA